MNTIKSLILTLCFSALMLTSCTIEPPLHLPKKETCELKMAAVEVILEVVWGVNEDWRDQWWYGWDEQDAQRWGDLAYPTPSTYEVRHFYQGEEPREGHQLVEDGSFTVWGDHFRRVMDVGYHDMLLWSNIDSKDGTQTVIINEKDLENVMATTTRSSLMGRANLRQVELKKQPDIFYAGYERNYWIPKNIEDYDYYDEKEKAWIKTLYATLDPMVYIYLVQIVIYNNKGRITGLEEDAVLTNMSEGVNLNTGRTLNSNIDITYGMRMKYGRTARGGRKADILGSMLTTYGLCGMPSWRQSKGVPFKGSRPELDNSVVATFRFANEGVGTFTYDVTPQTQAHPHGGVITIEIDADTITIPKPDPNKESSGFHPFVEEYGDTVVYEFGI